MIQVILHPAQFLEDILIFGGEIFQHGLLIFPPVIFQGLVCLFLGFPSFLVEPFFLLFLLLLDISNHILQVLPPDAVDVKAFAVTIPQQLILQNIFIASVQPMIQVILHPAQFLEDTLIFGREIVQHGLLIFPPVIFQGLVYLFSGFPFPLLLFQLDPGCQGILIRFLPAFLLHERTKARR